MALTWKEATPRAIPSLYPLLPREGFSAPVFIYRIRNGAAPPPDMYGAIRKVRVSPHLREPFPRNLQAPPHDAPPSALVYGGMPESTSSIVGCLLGTAVGDALGLPYKGLSSLSPQGRSTPCATRVLPQELPCPFVQVWSRPEGSRSLA